jgi:hypothetical protein
VASRHGVAGRGSVNGVAPLYRGRIYLLLVDARPEAITRRGSQVNIIASGWCIAQLQKTDLSAASPNPSTWP